MWFESLQNVKSLGSTTAKAKNMAGLHDKRKEHLSQFFTTQPIVAYIWSLLAPTLALAERSLNREVRLFDNSCGVGAMFQFADPKQHEIYGSDIHLPSVQKLSKALEDHGFEHEIKHADLAELKAGQFDIGLINPPFSIHLENPNLTEYLTNSFGKFGPATSANSHLYALEQAIDSCQVVFAVLPESMRTEIKANKHFSQRCHAIVKLPSDAFKSENANVSTILAVFTNEKHFGATIEIDCDNYKNIDWVPTFTLEKHRRQPWVKKSSIVSYEKKIFTPVTQNNKVRVTHNGRKIGLKFSCGITEAKVLNNIYGEFAYNKKAEGHRLSKDIVYTGSAKLDLEAYLVQPDPMQAFLGFVNSINLFGGHAEVCPSLMNYFKKRIKQVEINTTPLRKFVYQSDASKSTHEDFEAKAKNDYRVFPNLWGSPVIKAGESIKLSPVLEGSEKTYQGIVSDKEFKIDNKALHENFFVKKKEGVTGDWVCIHEGLLEAFPEQAKPHIAKAKKLGIDKWLWGFQLHDVIQASMRSVGTLFAWHMGTGKTRCIFSTALMGGKVNVAALPSHLIEQSVEELESLPISRDDWQIINKPEDLKTLKKINIISINKLKSQISRFSKKTYAHALRGRVHTLNIDEGHVVANTTSKQTRAFFTVNAKKTNIFTGTPISNYPRNVHAQSVLVAGDGIAEQPYGLRKSFLTQSHLNAPQHSPRGLDQLREDVCVFEWVTYQFEDENQVGGKREIPVINKPGVFREWVDQFMVRRIKDEPEVAKHIHVEDPVIEVPHRIKWDDAHLSHYLTVADDFANWFKKYLKENNGRINHMMAVLARINAVEQACNAPSESIRDFKSYGHQTTKQKAVVKRAKELYEQGHKLVIYGKCPAALNRMSDMLNDLDVENVVFHGEKDINKRNKDLKYFRKTNKPMVLLGSFGCTETGLNIPEADRILLYNRCWSAKTEEQSIYRLIRPQQTKAVYVERFHLEGSIDEYQHQMCEFKQNTIDVGLDYGEPLPEEIEFMHIDKILNDFIDKIVDLRGCKNNFELKEMLALAA